MGDLTTEGTFTTEAIWPVVPTSVGLVVPFVDPQGGVGNPENGGMALKAGEVWATATDVTPYPVHVFDAIDDDGTLLAFGSSQAGSDAFAQVWRSTDGLTWTSDLEAGNGTDDDYRFYAACLLEGDVLAIGTNHNANTETTWRRTAGTWSEVSSRSLRAIGQLVAWHEGGVPFAYGLVNGKHYGMRMPSAPAVIGWPETDVSGVSAPPGFCFDLAVGTAGTHLYALCSAGAVKRHDGTAWSEVMTIDTEDGRCIAVDEATGQVLIGTTDSKIRAYPLPA